VCTVIPPGRCTLGCWHVVLLVLLYWSCAAFMYHSGTQLYAHSYEQFLQVRPVGLALVSFCVFLSFLPRACLVVIGLVIITVCLLYWIKSNELNVFNF